VPGLAVRVLPSTVKSFVLIARFPGSRNPTRRALGAYGLLSLEASRNKARRWLELLARGIDPAKAVEREQREQERKRRTTFRALAEDYIAHEVIGPNLDRPNHRAPKIFNSVRAILIPLFGDRPVTELSADDIMPALELIGRIGTDHALRKLGARELLRRPGRGARPAPEQSRVLFSTLTRIFNWSIDHGGYGLDHSPLHRISKTRRLGTTVRRDRILSDEELVALPLVIERLPSPHRQAYQVLLHSGLRLKEAAGACWDEIEGDVWTIPAARMKGKNTGRGQARAHVVPLTPVLRKIFAAIPRGAKGDFIFSSKDGATPIITGGSTIKRRLDNQMLTILRERAEARGEDAIRVVLRPWRNHDIRRSCRSTLSRLGIRHEVAEAVLAHARGGVAGTYDRWQYLPEKRDALERWSAFLSDLTRPRLASGAQAS
jgi:hypothetical protein